MNQKVLITVLIVVAVILGAALAFTAGQRSALPEPAVSDIGAGNAYDDNGVPDGAVDEDEGLDQPIPPASDPEPSPGAQGDACLANADCASGLYCAKAGANACAATVAGTCETRPDVCAQVFAPVCGCDGETYSNACGAASAGVNVSAQGACN